jgi:uncharacterized protein YcbK (DUF882 family)
MRWIWISALLLGLCMTPSITAAAVETGPAVHVVYAGQTLGMIAKRYNVSIEALCAYNGIRRNSRIKPGQKLHVPDRNYRPGDGVAGKAGAVGKTTTAKAAPKGWRSYVKAPKRRGYVTLEATGRRWKGYATVKGDRLAKTAPEAFRRTLYSWRTGNEAEIHPRLISILIRVSDTFGGRPLRIASGYREHSYAKESKHKAGEACDFTIEGVPNEALRDYLLTLDSVGVGFYPNSSFVHLDVRSQKTTWIDTSTPGSAPRYVLTRKLGPNHQVRRNHLGPGRLGTRVANRE